jgi:hypothetical protein
MGKLILLMSFVCLGILLITGLAAPDSPIMWLAATSSGYAELRSVLMILLVALLVTTPPRNVMLRSLVGASAITLFSWCLLGTYNNQIQIVDSLAFMLVSVATGLAALEQGFEEKPITFERKATA